MARLIALLSVTLALASSLCVTATSTTPTVPNTALLPTWYVTLSASGLAVTSAPTLPSAALASGKYNRSNADIGWDYLEVAGADPQYMGYLEGYLTADVLMLQGIPSMPAGAVGTWIETHIAFMQEQVNQSASTSAFWKSVGDKFTFMQGIADGANAALAGKPNQPAKPLTMVDIFLVNFVPFELPDVQIAVQVQAGKTPKQPNPSIRGHCSALIKPTATDLFVAHDTWSGFTFMAYRIFKVYQVNDASQTMKTKVSFSAHPGLIASGDDWYQTAAGLAVMETTNGLYNNSLYTAVVPQTVSEFLRVAVATELATTGEEWSEYFSMFNSGTYNNQYMIVNFNLYAPGSTIVPGTLWVAEQLPGYIHRADQSKVLQTQGYWASYNIPFYPDVYALSGNLAQYELYGNFFSYSKYARPEIFRRNQSDVETVEDMMRMMRYNNYQVDPLSKIQNCSGAPNGQCQTPQTSMLSIASRGDLMTVYETEAVNVANYGPLWDYMAQGCFGAIDSKIASWSNRQSMLSWVISGPTNDQVPTFEWNTKACTGTPAPEATPTVVDFPWVQFQY